MDVVVAWFTHFPWTDASMLFASGELLRDKISGIPISVAPPAAVEEMLVQVYGRTWRVPDALGHLDDFGEWTTGNKESGRAMGDSGSL
jgi:hypothetical protein